MDTTPPSGGSSMIDLHIVHDAEVEGAGEVLVDVLIGDQLCRLVLDTGGTTSQVTAEIAHPYPAGDPPRDPGRGLFGGRTAEHRVVVAPHIRLGHMAASDFLLDVAGTAADGPPSLLGLDFLSGHRLDLRFSDATLEIDSATPVDVTRPLLTSRRGHPHVELEWDDCSALGIWDTGAGVTIVDREFAAAHPDLVTPLFCTNGTDAHGNTQPVDMVTLAACRIGGRTFTASIAALAPLAAINTEGSPAFDVIVGFPLISQANWMIDLRDNTWGYL